MPSPCADRTAKAPASMHGIKRIAATIIAEFMKSLYVVADGGDGGDGGVDFQVRFLANVFCNYCNPFPLLLDLRRRLRTL
jgi:hypothetical protein